jgi:hypothetical protein
MSDDILKMLLEKIEGLERRLEGQSRTPGRDAQAKPRTATMSKERLLPFYEWGWVPQIGETLETLVGQAGVVAVDWGALEVLGHLARRPSETLLLERQVDVDLLSALMTFSEETLAGLVESGDGIARTLASLWGLMATQRGDERRLSRFGQMTVASVWQTALRLRSRFADLKVMLADHTTNQARDGEVRLTCIDTGINTQFWDRAAPGVYIIKGHISHPSHRIKARAEFTTQAYAAKSRRTVLMLT